MTETTKDIINKYRNALADGSNLTPELAGQYIVELSSYLGNLNDVFLERQMKYNDVKAFCLKEIKSVAKADIKAQCSSEYRDLLEIKMYRDLVVEFIRSLKYYIRGTEDEKSFSKYT